MECQNLFASVSRSEFAGTGRGAWRCGCRSGPQRLDAIRRRSHKLVAILVKFLHPAGVAELADARASTSRDLHWSCGFDPHLQHHKNKALYRLYGLYTHITAATDCDSG